MHVRGLDARFYYSYSYFRWVKSMGVLGFSYCKDKGSRRTFKPRGSELKHNFRWHQVCLEAASGVTYSADRPHSLRGS